MIYPVASVIQPLNNWGQMQKKFTLFSNMLIIGAFCRESFLTKGRYLQCNSKYQHYLKNCNNRSSDIVHSKSVCSELLSDETYSRLHNSLDSSKSALNGICNRGGYWNREAYYNKLDVT